jgi:uncharacterized phage-associated protein
MTLPANSRSQLAGHDALAVANLFLDLGTRDGVPIDHLKLQKLVYLAHGWHLGLTGEPLIFQPVLAWPYGPIINDVYHEFKECGRNNISGRATIPADGVHRFERIPYRAELTVKSREIVDRVWEVFKGNTGIELSAMSHAPGTPWHQVTNGKKPKEIKDIPIGNQQLRDYFQSLARERSRANA